MQEHLHTVALPYAADVPTLEEKCEYSIPVGACVVLSEPFVSDYALKEFALWNRLPNFRKGVTAYEQYCANRNYCNYGFYLRRNRRCGTEYLVTFLRHALFGGTLDRHKY